MPETLVIRLPDERSAEAEWLPVNGEGVPVGAVVAGALGDATEAANDRTVVVLAPASAVLRTRASIPLKGRARIRQALPFALEEALASDIEDQHFAFEKGDAEGRIPVAVVSIDLLDTWLSALSAADIKVDALYAESDGVTVVPATITVLVDGSRILIREPDGTSTIADADSLQVVLELLLDATTASDTVHDEAKTDDPENAATDNSGNDDTERDANPVNLIVYTRESDHDRHAMLWDMLRLRVDSLDVKLLPDGALPRLASQIATSGGVNLLQGRYGLKTDFTIPWQQWRVAAILLAGTLALTMLQQGVYYWQLSSEESALDSAAAEVLRAAFSDAGDVQDPWIELRSRLGDTSSSEIITGGPGFAEGVELLASAFTKTASIKLEALSYRDGNIDLQLIAPNVATLDQLRQSIVASDSFNAEIQSANPDNDKIKGRMKISVAEKQ